ncbi:MAG TPA: response regulator [Opitutaceae bacterium]|jgi:DNA-binding response OmpR family regulator|nr:response regulator [Opitutaceae bacterium]
MNILIVDDHPNLARVTSLALRTLGCLTFTAGTTAAATHLLNTEKVDGILLDVNLGAESGLEFLSQLVAEGRPPVIMFTAQTEDEIAAEALSRGAFGCLVKPFNLEDLGRQVKRIEERQRDRSGV